MANNTPDQTQTIPPVKRLRLGGDWSDTGRWTVTNRLTDSRTLLGLVGPDARPSTEAEASESVNHPADPTDDQEDSVRRGRNLQNTFMQRMSDIFTQLVTRTTSDTELESQNIPSTAQSGQMSPTRTAESQQTHNSTASPSTDHRNAPGNEADVSSSTEILVFH